MASEHVTVRVPNWLLSLIPLALIGLLVGVIVAFNPIENLRDVPAVERVAFERTTFEPGRIELLIRNDGPDPVRIAQVLVNDAYWQFEAGDMELRRLETTTITIAYPWEPGLPANVSLVTSTGVVIPHEIEAAALTPEFDVETLGIYALLGIYIGVVPISIGLLWFSALRRASQRWLSFFLAFTVGLLAFLLVDTTGEGLELAGEAAAALDGLALFAIGALVAIICLLRLENALATRRSGREGLFLAYLIAVGIGLHNLGEGLAVGAALAAGEVALGTFLVLGFALHNTTEGLAIVAPLGREGERPALRHFALLGAIAGVPAIAGAWAGGFIFNAAWAALAFGVAAGAIAQVIWTIGRSIKGGLATAAGAGGFVAGLGFMYLTSLLTA